MFKLVPTLQSARVPRGDAGDLLGIGTRQTSRIISALIKESVLTAESTRAPLKLAFPARLTSRWLPGLFPDI